MSFLFDVSPLASLWENINQKGFLVSTNHLIWHSVVCYNPSACIESYPLKVIIIYGRNDRMHHPQSLARHLKLLYVLYFAIWGEYSLSESDVVFF